MLHRTLALRASLSILFLGCAALASADTPKIDTPSGPVQVLRITPEGEVNSAQRQVVIQFDRPMVVLGSVPPRLDNVPVNITPALDCNWHWVNTATLACELGSQKKPALEGSYSYGIGEGGFAPATLYHVVLHAGIKALDGTALAHDADDLFNTEKPQVMFSRVQEWSGPTQPVIQVMFNLPVTKRSVEAHLHFVSRLGQGAVSAVADPRDPRPYYVLPAGGGAPVLVPGKARAGESEDEDEGGDEDSGGDSAAPATASKAAPAAAVPAGEEARQIWLVAAGSGVNLPAGESMSLVSEPGLVTPLGPETGAGEGRPLEFYTYGAFSFTGVACGDEEDGAPYLDDPKHPQAGTPPSCNPQRYVSMVFSAPVTREQLESHLLASVGGKSVDPVGEVPDARYGGYQPPRQPHTFRVFFAVPLKANADYSLSVKPGMQDIWGRAITAAGSARFHTEHRDSSLDLNDPTAVLEKGVDSEIPLFPTNLDSLSASYTRLSAPGGVAPVAEHKTLDYKLPDIKDLAFELPLGLRGMLDGQSGVVEGHLQPNPDTTPNNYGRDPYKFFAEVTPFHVHVKLGHFNTLVWVTDMATGQPVSGAHVRIYSGTRDTLSQIPSSGPSADTDASGIAMLPGGATLDPDGVLRQPDYSNEGRPQLMVLVQRGQDLALLPLDYDFAVNTYVASHDKVGEDIRKVYGHLHAWGTTAEGIYRAGDTIQYEVFVRDQNNSHFILPPPDASFSLELVDPMGNVVMQQDKLQLSEFGSYAGEYAVPQTAPVGWYTFHISLTGSQAEDGLTPMQVLVSDFTPAPFHVDAALNGASFHPGDPVEVTTTARLHSGGPYTDAQGRVSVVLKAEDFTSKDPAAADFTFSSYDGQGNERDQTIQETDGKVDDQGVLKTDFTLQDAGVYYGKLLVEGDVRDERGKYIAAVTRADYLGRDRYVGLRLHGWVMQTGQPASVDYLVVDGAGKPVPGTAVKLTVERMELKASRVKGPGNAYLTQYAHDWVAAGGCDGTSAATAATCQFTPPQPGSYRIKASVTDTHGREHDSALPSWAIGKGEVLWEDNDDGALTVVPEKTDYKVGDTARYLVQNPYPGAKALVSIERYGVIKSWVQSLDGSTPVISFPIEQDYVPGFYLSVVVVSPRVAKPLAPGEVDLGKPAFRSAYLPVDVVDDYKAIDLNVTTPKDSYKPRDTVTVSLTAKARHGQAGRMQLAVAVLDDSVFDLLAQGKDYFDPYKGFYKLDGLDEKNYSLLLRLVGRQAFEKKGATPGGDGGTALSLRSLFKFVGYWNPALKTDADGKAKFTFQVPDNLTSWRVLAIAVNTNDRMGLGQGSFKVNRPTELRPIMPNQVVQGDAFGAGFSVMNRTDKARDLKVHVTAKGQVQGAPVLDQLLHVEPYKRVEVWLPVTTTTPGSVDFVATAGDAADSDGLKQSVPVKPLLTSVSLAQYGTATATTTEPVQYPADAAPGSVQLGVNLSPTVIGNVQGAFRYMRDYPYFCWEQRLTTAVMAANYKRLHAYLGKSVDWPGSDGLPAQALSDAAGFQAPGGGMTYWVADDRYADPYLSAYTALAFDWLKADGYAVPATVEQKLHAYLQRFLKGDGVPDYYDLGMRSSVRAVILAALAVDHEVTLDDLHRFEPAVKDMSLFGKAWFMQAALDLNGGDLASEDLKQILNHGNETGGKFEFSEALDDGYSRILSTPMRSNCAVLSALARYSKSQQTDAGTIGAVPFKLVRSITQIRGGRDYWDNTQENIFCMQALADYAQAYEQVAPAMHLAVTAGTQSLGQADFHSVQDAAVALVQPFAAGSGPVPVTLTQSGSGRYYYTLRLSYAPKSLPASINDGIGIHREYSVQRDGKWVLLTSPMAVTRGELVRVDLYVSVPAPREFVVVDDPVAGGLEPVDSNLATSSVRDAKAGGYQAAGGAYWFNFDDWRDFGVQFWDFYHQELRHDAARFYADYLPAGHYHLSYSAQAIASGVFAVQPPKVAEMYDPDVFGLDAAAVLKVSDPKPAAP